MDGGMERWKSGRLEKWKNGLVDGIMELSKPFGGAVFLCEHCAFFASIVV
jgi:hypothetical protein